MPRKKKKIEESPEEQYKHRQLREIVLAALGLSVLIGGIMITPNFPIVMGGIMNLIKEFKKKDISTKKVKRVLKNLEKKEIIHLEMKGDEVHVYLKNWLTPSIVKYSLKAILELKRSK